MCQVFSDKKCTVEIVSAGFGRTGFRRAESGNVEEVVYDKGGTERRTREEGGDFTANDPGWIGLVEFRRRKEARSRAWKKSHEGQKDFLDRHRRLERLSESRHGWGLCDEGEFPLAAT